MSSDLRQILEATERLILEVQPCAATITRTETRSAVRQWGDQNLPILGAIWTGSDTVSQAVRRVGKMEDAWRLRKRYLLRDLRTIRSAVKERIRGGATTLVGVGSNVIGDDVLDALKGRDRKIFVLAQELNSIWRVGGSPNACGILMRIILERALDAKDPIIKSKPGLKEKINFSQSSTAFGRSVREAIGKLSTTTKITGDIVAHDSKILLSPHDVEPGVVPLNMLLKDVFG